MTPPGTPDSSSSGTPIVCHSPQLPRETPSEPVPTTEHIVTVPPVNEKVGAHGVILRRSAFCVLLCTIAPSRNVIVDCFYYLFFYFLRGTVNPHGKVPVRSFVAAFLREPFAHLRCKLYTCLCPLLEIERLVFFFVGVEPQVCSIFNLSC